jgi:hypothetical protein
VVKLEDSDGLAVFVAPEHVATINAAAGDGYASVWDVGGTHIDVKGTPDEVHAKLFPEHPVTSATTDDALTVLEWVASEEGPDTISLPSRMVTLARKALGRGD